MSKLQSGMESGYMRDETLPFISTERGCSYDVINVPLVELRNEPCIGGQYAFLHVSYEEACIVRAHSTTNSYTTNLAVVLLVEGERV